VGGDQPLELAAKRSEPAGLDLDQRSVADEVDDEAVDRVLDKVARPLVPALDLRVERALVERADHRAALFAPGASGPSSTKSRLRDVHRVAHARGRRFQRGRRPTLERELSARASRIEFHARRVRLRRDHVRGVGVR
jgi:hypothetical protein